MNKNIAMLLLSVVLLAMILIVLNQWAFGPAEVQRERAAEFADILKKSPRITVPESDEIAGPSGGVSKVRIPVEGAPAGFVTPSPEDALPVANAPGGPARQDGEKAVQPEAQTGAGTGALATGSVSGTQPEDKRPLAPADGSAPATAPAAATASSKTGASSAPEASRAVAQDTPKPEAKTAVTNTLTALTFAPSGREGVLRIVAKEPFEYKTFALPQPQRIVVDVLGHFTALPKPVLRENSLVSDVRVGWRENGIRVVLDLTGNTKHAFDVEKTAPEQLKLVVR